jgi:hypothetical protein
MQIKINISVSHAELSKQEVDFIHNFFIFIKI